MRSFLATSSRARAGALGLASAALFSACGGSCAPGSSSAPASAPPIVIWIEVDTLRADALGCYGNTSTGENGCAPSPNLDALARDGVRFEHAYSAAPWTIPSFVTQLSGLWPWEHGATHLLEPIGEAHTALVPLVARAGLRTGGVMTNFVATSRYGFERGFERWDDSFATGHTGATSREALDKLLAMADELGGARERGLFLMGWLFEPHYRYEAHEGLRFGPGHSADSPADEVFLKGDEPLEALLRRRASLSPEDIAYLRGNYQSEVAYVDASIGWFVQGLKQRGLYDRAWIVFTADHGEEILDHGWIGHSVTLREEVVHVPLIVKPPRGVLREGAQRVRPDYVSLIDLPATLLEISTGRAPDRAKVELGHSRSLVPTILEGKPSERRWLYLHTNFEPVVKDDLAELKSALQWGVIDATRGWKWIVDHRKSRPVGFLLDVASDPPETRDIARDDAVAPHVATFQRLRALEPRALLNELSAPAWLPEEPWGPRAKTSDGFGPGFPPSER